MLDLGDPKAVIEALTKKLQDAEAKIKELEDIDRSEEKAALASKIEKLEAELKDRDAKIVVLGEQIDVVKKSVESKDAEISKVTSAKDVAEAKLADIELSAKAIKRVSEYATKIGVETSAIADKVLATFKGMTDEQFTAAMELVPETKPVPTEDVETKKEIVVETQKVEAAVKEIAKVEVKTEEIKAETKVISDIDRAMATAAKLTTRHNKEGGDK